MTRACMYSKVGVWHACNRYRLNHPDNVSHSTNEYKRMTLCVFEPVHEMNHATPVPHFTIPYFAGGLIVL